jgi:undecaprenyl-diphosphatase
MEIPLLLKALILGVVEGLTEFLPISSTGHLILVGDLLGFNDEKGKIFQIAIQTGAMLSVVWEYRAKFASALTGLLSERAAQRFVLNVIIAFVPAAVFGLLFGGFIKATLFRPVPVAIAFIVGALVILWAERRRHVIRVESVDDMTWLDALKVDGAMLRADPAPRARAPPSSAACCSGFPAAPRLSFLFSWRSAERGRLRFVQEPRLFHARTSACSRSVHSRRSFRFPLHSLAAPHARHDHHLRLVRIVFGGSVPAAAYTGLVTWTVG